MAQGMQEREESVEINCQGKWDRDDRTLKGLAFREKVKLLEHRESTMQVSCQI